MKCITCGGFYKKKVFDITFECDVCRDVLPNYAILEQIDSLEDADLKQVVNPSGRTPAYLYD